MTRKDYELIAAVFQRQADDAMNSHVSASAVFGSMVRDMAAKLEWGNEAFDVARFYKACGYHHD
jgi:hypothetical protein